MAGAIGLSIADLLDPRYVASRTENVFPEILHRLHCRQKSDRSWDWRRPRIPNFALRIAALSAVAGLGFNVIFDPIIRVFVQAVLS